MSNLPPAKPVTAAMPAAPATLAPPPAESLVVQAAQAAGVKLPVGADPVLPNCPKVGERVLLTAVHGRLIHPYQLPTEFNPGDFTKVDVDEWVRTQFNAGKLQRAE